MISYIKRNTYTIIFLFLAVSILFCFYFDLLKKELIITTLGVLVALYIGLQKQKSDDDNLFKNLFESFNEKYDSELNDLMNTLRIETEKELSRKEVNQIIDYFNLCAEEYLWYKKRRIPNDVWKAWKNGIIENLKIPQVKSIFEREIASKNSELSYYGLIKELKQHY